MVAGLPARIELVVAWLLCVGEEEEGKVREVNIANNNLLQ
jgi:hypothetical protein